MTKGQRTIRRTEECRWSVPAVRLNPMSDRDDDFESIWTCELIGAAVTADDCRRCTHWWPKRDDHCVRVGRR